MIIRTTVFCYAVAGMLCSTVANAQTDAISVQCVGIKQSSAGGCSPGQGAVPGSCWSVPVSSNEMVSVIIDGERSRIKIPSSLFSGSGDGWFPISELKAGDQFVTGRFKLSNVTKPRLKMDRIAGTIDIQSSSYLGASFSFSGSCEKSDLQTRKF
jgi:hypothetical protein